MAFQFIFNIRDRFYRYCVLLYMFLWIGYVQCTVHTCINWPDFRVTRGIRFNVNLAVVVMTTLRNLMMQ